MAAGISCVALDIGGANLKLADGRGLAISRPFPLWERPQELAKALASLLQEAPQSERVAVTMTGELADCYASKREGVSSILDAAQSAAAGREVLVYLVDGTLVPPPEAREKFQLAAASNWHALANFVAQLLAEESKSAEPVNALSIDVGSTTTDIIPIRAGRVAALGSTDPTRLAAGELVYTGVLRTPVCAVVQSLPTIDGPCPIAAELFATTRDVYLLIGEAPEDADDLHTADGRPATCAAAAQRMARMVCGDEESHDLDWARSAARQVAASQLDKLCEAARQVLDRQPQPPTVVITSGSGEFLARRLVGRLGLSSEIISLTSRLGPEVSQCAPAHALAVLAFRWSPE